MSSVDNKRTRTETETTTTLKYDGSWKVLSHDDTRFTEILAVPGGIMMRCTEYNDARISEALCMTMQFIPGARLDQFILFCDDDE